MAPGPRLEIRCKARSVDQAPRKEWSPSTQQDVAGSKSVDCCACWKGGAGRDGDGLFETILGRAFRSSSRRNRILHQHQLPERGMCIHFISILGPRRGKVEISKKIHDIAAGVLAGFVCSSEYEKQNPSEHLNLHVGEEAFLLHGRNRVSGTGNTVGRAEARVFGYNPLFLPKERFHHGKQSGICMCQCT